MDWIWTISGLLGFVFLTAGAYGLGETIREYSLGKTSKIDFKNYMIAATILLIVGIAMFIVSLIMGG